MGAGTNREERTRECLSRGVGYDGGPMSYTREQVLEITRDVLVRHARGPVSLTENTELVADLGVDSLGVMEALAEVEDRFEIAFDDDDLRAIATYGELCDVVLAKRAAPSGSATHA